MSQKGKTLLAALLMTLLSAPNAGAETGVSDKQIIIGTCNALSGNNEFSGKETTIGIKTYFAQLNAEGGVNGRKIQVVSCDDKYEPEGAYNCFQQMQTDNAFAITGLVGSALLAKYIPMCKNKRLPAVGFYSGPTFVSTPAQRYIFTVRPGYRAEEQQFVDHLWTLGIRRFGIIYQNDSYGADHLEGMREALKGHNTEIVVATSYQRNTNDLRNQFEALRKANPEAVSLAANHTQCMDIIQMAHNANWHPIFFINSGANVDGFMQKAGKEADGVLVGETVPSPTRVDLPLIDSYTKSLKKYFPKEKPCYTSLRGYIDARVLAEGLKRAGKDLTREKFVDALETIKSLDIGMGKDSEVTYSPTDHFGIHKYIFGTVKNGDVVQLRDWKTILKK